MISSDMIKHLVRKIIVWLNLDLTKNLKYDRLTNKIISNVVNASTTCIDIGAHKGEILELFIQNSPHKKHYAFEPIPHFNKLLQANFSGNSYISSVALSNKKSQETFNFVKNAPAYSGLKKRKYNIKTPEIQKIQVQVDLLDNQIPKGEKIDLIKIDVEGAELQVLKGAIRILRTSKPLLIFEFGMGASDFYGSTPKEIYSLLVEDFNYKLYTLESFLKKQPHLSLEELENHYSLNSEYYFIAS